jgi:Glycosyl hydrolase-like 10
MKLVQSRQQKSEPQSRGNKPRRWFARCFLAALGGSAIALASVQPADTMALMRKSDAIAASDRSSPTCTVSEEAAAEKEALRQSSLAGDTQAKSRYLQLVGEHAEQVQECRRQTWPNKQAMWLRLYPCDAKPGAVEDILDRIVNRGYNEVYVEVFYDSQVLLPQSDNPTVWESAIRGRGQENVDLLSQAIQKGRERGLKVYAWLFTMNFGYTYGQLPDRQNVLAKNGYGQTTLTAVDDKSAGYDGVADSYSNQAFVDPYHAQARQDYSWLVYSVLKRQPDGVLFDYVRYPRRSGGDSVVTRVQDLWIYGEAATRSLYQRALNQKGRALIEKFLQQGFVSAGDVEAVNKQYPQEREAAQWQGRDPSKPVQQQLWYFTVAHAVQGVIDFLSAAADPVQRQGLPAGAVFFPEGNQTIGQGFDSRLQAWDRFPSSMQWHPMVYGVCGENNTRCIVEQVQRVLSYAPPGTEIIPALAGKWGQPEGNRPSLEKQMQDIKRAAPQINSISHFAYSWQEPESDRQRKFCSLD